VHPHLPYYATLAYRERRGLLHPAQAQHPHRAHQHLPYYVTQAYPVDLLVPMHGPWLTAVKPLTADKTDWTDAP
jgi:hypothetical protein